MKRLAIPLALLAACTQQNHQDQLSNTFESNTAASEEPLSPPAPGEVGGLPDDRAPVAEGPIDPRSPQGAGQVLQTYFALLEAGKTVEAGGLWSNDSGKAEFDARLANYREIHANIGAPGEPEGAAGSSYVEIPVQLYGRLKDGKEFNARGSMTLRRVNDVPGSTAEQRKWRIYQAEFPAAAAPASYRFVGRWATDAGNCSTRAWRFTADRLMTPAGSVCRFRQVSEVPGGYDIAARCTAEGPPMNDTLELRFAESAKALLFESKSIADAGLVRCR